MRCKILNAFLSSLVLLGAVGFTACGAVQETQDGQSSDPATHATSKPPTPSGRVTASPAQVPVPASGVGTTRICYNSNIDWSQVWVSVDGAPDTLFMMEHHQGCGDAPWIVRGHSYEFRLYYGQAHGLILDRVTVTGYNFSPPNPCGRCATGSSCHCGDDVCWPSNRPCP